jgi:electron transport complex protein RnfB
VSSLADRIDALLPQTQCTRCGYPDCRAYAEAIAHKETSINRCPPGGDETIQALAGLLQYPVEALDPAVGTFVQGTVAVIDEPLCIGCTKCIQACPVDAIVGKGKQMHTVIEALCTGCELCLPPCPVDCIRLVPAKNLTQELGGWRFPTDGAERTAALRDLYLQHTERLTKTKSDDEEQAPPLAPIADATLIAQRRAEIAAARARVQAKRDAQKKT